MTRRSPSEAASSSGSTLYILCSSNDAGYSSLLMQTTNFNAGFFVCFIILNPSIAFVSYPCVQCHELHTSVIRRYGHVHFVDESLRRPSASATDLSHISFVFSQYPEVDYQQRSVRF